MSGSDSQNVSVGEYGAGDIDVNIESWTSPSDRTSFVFAASPRHEGGTQIGSPERSSNQPIASTSGREAIPLAIVTGPVVPPSRSNILPPSLTADENDHLDPNLAGEHVCLITKHDRAYVEQTLANRFNYSFDRSKNVVGRHHDGWIALHIDSLKAPLPLPFTNFYRAFLAYFRILPAQIAPNTHRTLACFPQICSRHNVPCTVTFFRALF